MTIALQTDSKMTQLANNVEELYASIKSHYTIVHSERSQGNGLLIQFGIHPIKEHCIKFSSYNGGKAQLRLSNLKPDFIESVTGLRPAQLGHNEAKIRKEQGNDVANAYANTFQDRINAYFGNESVKMDIDTYMGAKCSLIIDISSLNENIIKTVSEVLQYSSLTPRADQERIYDL